MRGVLRITEITNCNATTLKLEGKLLAPWIDELHCAFSAASARGKPIHLDLQQLSFADSVGIEQVRELVNRGAVVAVCSDFIWELLVGKVL